MKYFEIQELVPPQVYAERGDKALQLLDRRLLDNLDTLRLQLDVPLTVNNWHWGGDRKYSGLRVYGSEHWGMYSQHSFGRAADVICEVPAEEIRQKIRSREIILPWAVHVELDVDWLHMDVRNSRDLVNFFHG